MILLVLKIPKLSTFCQYFDLFPASLIPGLSLIGVCLSGCDRISVVILMIVAQGFYGAMFAGVMSNHTDIASNYAGIIKFLISLDFDLKMLGFKQEF